MTTEAVSGQARLLLYRNFLFKECKFHKELIKLNALCKDKTIKLIKGAPVKSHFLNTKQHKVFVIGDEKGEGVILRY